MVRHIVRLALVQGLLLGTLPALGPDRPSEETVSAPAAATATAEAVVDTREAAEPISEKVDLAATGEGKTITDGEDANQPATIVSTAFDPNADPNLVAWWKLDGDTADSSGHGLDGQPKGEPQWVEGRIGGAVELDGVDDYIDCGSPPRLAIRSRLTVACWVKIASFTRTWETILAKGDNSYRLGRFRDTSRGVHFACTGTDPDPPWLNSVVTLADDRWHHIAGVYDGASIVLYVDGREVARKAAGGAIQESEQPLCLGENSESGGRFLRGLLDDVRIYDRALRQEEIVVLVGPHVAAAAGAEEPAAGVIRQAEDGEVELPGSRPGVGTSYMTTVLLVGGLLVLVVAIVMLGMMPGRKGQGGEPGMVWKIARKEFLLNVMTFKFAVATVACLVLAAVFTPVLAKDYQQRVTTYHSDVARNEAELRKVTVYKNIVPTVFRPPSVLSVFSEGLEKRIGNSSTIELDRVPEIRAATTQGNPYQSVFPVFDVALIFRVVLSVLALLVAYDAISGEREQGTLKLMLAGTARRHQMLLAKLLAGLLVLVVPVTMTFIVVLILLLSFPMVDLARPEWTRIGLMYLASLVFVSAMYNLGLLISCLTRKSAIALVLGIFAWVVFVVVVPNGGAYLAAELRPLEPEEKRAEWMMALQQEYQDELSISQPQDDPDVERVQSDAADVFGRSYHRLLNKPAMEYFLKYYQVVCTLGDRYADEFWRVEHSYVNTLFAQNNLARKLSRISPASLYDDVMSTLAGTDVARYQSFTMAVRTYRNRIIDYIRSRTDNFTSPRLFTPYTLEEMEHLPRGAEAPSLDLRDLPQFTFQVHDVKDLHGALADLAMLILVNLLLFSLSLAVFMKYDAR